MLTSYELALAILFRWRAWSCVRDIVWLWRSHVSGHGSDHHTLATWYCAIAHLPTFELQSFYLLSIRSYRPRHCFVITIPFCCFVFISTLGNAVFSLHLRAYCCVHWKEGYQSLSALAVSINTLEVAEYPLLLGGGWPDDVRFPRRSEDTPPLVIVWAEDALIMRQTLMM